jgi:hypothetical protein
MNVTIVRLVRLALALCLAGLSIATRPALVSAQFGTCSGCTTEEYWDPDLGKWCTRYYCTDPNFPSCLVATPGARVCEPGDSAVTTQCSGVGIDYCTYTCSSAGTGWSAPSCTQAGNSGNTYRNFCNWSAGCPRGPNGEVDGRLTRVSMICTQLGTTSQVIDEQACGSCRRTTQCLPGQPCTCDDAQAQIGQQPVCSGGVDGWSCSWNGLTVVSVGRPCPQVRREPFPRAIVGQPVRMEIIGGCSGPSASNTVEFGITSGPNCPRVFAYRGALSWQCSDPAWNDATWRMDERAWNIGQRSDNGASIEDVRVGRAIAHIYETSSIDKPRNGPVGQRRDPAYQVQLRTSWTLAGNFQYREQRTEQRCTDIDGNARQCGIDSDIAITETVIVSPWVNGPSILIPNILIDGATLPQDIAAGGACGVIGVPVVQAQSVLRP